jgi:branched-chain amino acid aminotransferase
MPAMNALTPIMTAILTPAGLQPTPYQATSLNDAALYEPPGVYTVGRTYDRDCVLEINAHFDRTEESARLVGIPARLDRPAIRAALRTLIDRGDYPESRFRLTLPRTAPDQLYLAVEPLSPVPSEVRARGVKVRSFPVHRQNPRAKDNQWMVDRAALKAQMTPDDYEGLLTTPEGHLLEGLSSNFYAIRDGALYTAPNGVLEGISRRIVMAVAPEILDMHEKPVTLADLPVLQEAFLTSSSRGIIPVVAIDGQTIGEGTPGPFTRTLAERYDAWALAHLEPL